MKFFNRVIVALTLCLGWQGVSQAQKLPSIQLQAGLYKIVAEVAATEQSRQLGLMHRNYLPPDEGMLFVFESKGTHCFWMRNNKIPLTIAFLADDGKIVNIIELKAMTKIIIAQANQFVSP